MMKLRRASVLFAALVLARAGGLVFAADAATERSQVRAAEEAAREDLRGQVLAATLDADGLTVRAMTDRLGSADSVETALGSAEQLGGPRWTDGFTCQVKLRLAGERVIESVRGADVRGVRPGALAGRTFVATGTSVPPDRVGSFIPADLPPAWRGVPEADRTAAVLRARDSAVGAIERQCRELALPDSPPPTPAVSRPATGALDFSAFAKRLPVTRVSLREDAQVEVAVFVDRVGLTEQVTQAPAGRGADVVARINRLPALVVGRAKVESATAAVVTSAPAAVRVALPAVPPAWLRDSITAQGVAPLAQSKLRTARRAETVAVAALRQRVEALKLNDTLSLGQAAAADPRYQAALDRALGQARPYKVDYRADGSVAVSVSIDANALWGEIVDDR